MLKKRKYVKFLLFFISLCLISCVSKPLITVEEFEKSLVERGYTEWTKENSITNIEIALLLEKERHSISQHIITKCYGNFQVRYTYIFLEWEEEMINRYVLVTFIDKHGNEKKYEKKNQNNEKGQFSQINGKFENMIDGRIIENPVMYYWD